MRTSPAERQVIERLRAVLARARDPEPSRRPSARALSGLLAEIAGEPVSGGPIRLPRPTSADSVASAAPHPLAPAYAAARAALGQLRPRVATRAWAILLALAATLIVGFGARAALASGTPREQPNADVTFAAVSAPDTVATTATTTAPRVWPTSVPCPELALAGERRDVDGDGCPEAVRIDGAQVVVDGARYDVGAPGDAVAVADWDCDGTDTPAVVRPSTGDVFVFDAWATAEAPMPGRLLDRVPGAIAPETPNGTCDVVPVVDVAGAHSAVALEGEDDR